jgi:hypothetical protein
VLGDTSPWWGGVVFGTFGVYVMKPVHRSHVSKGRSAGQFKKHVSHTKSANIAGAPMRGGWRL